MYLRMLNSVLFSLSAVLLTSCVATSELSCSLPKGPCELAVMKDRLENVVNLTSAVIDALIKKNGESTNCPSQPEDCAAIYNCRFHSSGVYTVWPKNRIINNSVQVFCDMDTDGGGWTVIQRRGNFGRAKEYFFNDWNSYREGFGDISQDFWLGNDLIFALTNQKLNVLRFDLADLEGVTRWAKYDKFWIDSEEHNYLLHVQGYTGTAGDSFTHHNGKQFSTKDKDNDPDGKRHCAVLYKGAWWYDIQCHLSNLNGFYLNGTHESYADGIEWYSWRGFYYSLPFTEMKIRPLLFKPNGDKSEMQNPV